MPVTGLFQFPVAVADVCCALFSLEDEDVWDQFAFTFEEADFEIYEGMRITYSTKELLEEIGAPAKRRLEVREICDDLLVWYYKLEEFATMLAENERDALFTRWMTYLGRVTGPIRKAGVEELLVAIPEVPRAWVEAMDSQLRAEGASDSMLEGWIKKPGPGDDDVDWEELEG